MHCRDAWRDKESSSVYLGRTSQSVPWWDPTIKHKINARHDVLGLTRVNSPGIYLRERRGSDSCLQPPSLLFYLHLRSSSLASAGTQGASACFPLGGQHGCWGVWCESQSPGSEQAAWMPPPQKYPSILPLRLLHFVIHCVTMREDQLNWEPTPRSRSRLWNDSALRSSCEVQHC